MPLVSLRAAWWEKPICSAGVPKGVALPAKINAQARKRQKATRRKAFAPQFTIINFLEPDAPDQHPADRNTNADPGAGRPPQAVIRPQPQRS